MKISIGDWTGFTASDFTGTANKPIDCRDGKSIPEWCAQIANRILAEKLKLAPKVYGNQDYDHGVMVYLDSEDVASEPTHTARLVCIEPIEKKEEK